MAGYIMADSLPQAMQEKEIAVADPAAKVYATNIRNYLNVSAHVSGESYLRTCYSGLLYLEGETYRGR